MTSLDECKNKGAVGKVLITIIGPDLLERGLPHVEHFSSEGKDAVAVPPHHAQPRHGKSLG